MKCPGCDSDIKPLVEKPVEVNGITWVNADSTVTGTMNVEPNPTSAIFKCCNPTCWITRVEVDWNHG
jgi:hypothetical protein